MLDRSDADVRGVQTGASVAQVTHAVAGIHIGEEEKKSGVAKKGKKKATTGAASSGAAAQGAPASSLQEVFSQFAGGAKEMDGKTFAKFAKDSKLIGKTCSTTDIDLIFASSKEKTGRKINYQQFLGALEKIAKKRSKTMQDQEQEILGHGGPVFAGTAAEAVRFHDDKDQYTGVHAHGGPSTVGGTGGVSDIS